MLKKMLISSILTLFAINANATKIEYLQGDQSLACQALLCLASPVRPPECASAIAKYFAIKFTKPWKTITARKNFLNLCPTQEVGGIIDKDLEDWKNNILPNLNSDCYVPDLNKRVEKTILWVEEICTPASHDTPSICYKINHYGYRINPNLTRDCKLLASSPYSNYKLKYVCNNKFYTEEEWNNEYVKKEISKEEYDKLEEKNRVIAYKYTQISYREYLNLPEDQRTIKRNQNGFTAYYKVSKVYCKKEWINKECWINEDK